jgi:uncharacterized protein (TIGR02145 family)
MTSIDTATKASWSFWVNQPTLSLGKWMLSKYDANYLAESWFISTPPASFGIGNDEIAMVFDAYAAYAYTSTHIFSANTWYHVTFVYDGSQSTNETKLKLYVNGKATNLTIGGNIPTSITTVARTMKIGADSYGGGADNYFNGYLDDVRIYNRALTQAEITQLYNLGKAKLNINTTGSNKGTSVSGPTSGLVGYWTFNGPDTNWTSATGGTTNDVSGNNNTGTLTNMSRSTSPVAGVIGQGLKFDGVNNSVTTTFTSQLNDFTVSFWFKDNNFVDTAYERLVDKNYVGGFWLGRNASSANSWGGGILETSDPYGIFGTFTDGQWNYMTSIRRGTKHELYANGVFVTSNTVSAAALDTTALQIGNGTTNQYGGVTIDDVRIYNRALSQAEITQLYNLGKARTYINPCGGSVKGLDGLTYGVVKAEDGKCWLDRNLGAHQVATAANNGTGYGSLYQWGRLYDGHQATTSGTTVTQSSGDVPGNANFIKGSSDWRSTNNDALWNGVNGTNNPCPTGFRLPTQAEWATEVGFFSPQTSVGAFSSALKLPMAGYRSYSGGSLLSQGGNGNYWSGSPVPSSTNAYYLFFGAGGVFPALNNRRAYGYSVRCVKN